MAKKTTVKEKVVAVEPVVETVVEAVVEPVDVEVVVEPAVKAIVEPVVEIAVPTATPVANCNPSAYPYYPPKPGPVIDDARREQIRFWSCG